MEVTSKVLSDIGHLGPRDRQAALSAIGQQEWSRSADDVCYWLDEARHPTLGPYVMTLDNHPLHQCKHCSPEVPPCFSYKRTAHLKIRHEIDCKAEKELQGHFVELPTIRPFPLRDYMRPIIDVWLQEQMVLVEKTRDMIATWLMTALSAWDVIFHPGRQHIFISEDAPKTLELVERAKFMYDHQPAFLQRHETVYKEGTHRSGLFRLPKLSSEIRGLPQGSREIRQFHPTLVYFDEAAHQENAGQSFAAIQPAIRGGGRFVATSSAYPGWFFLACRDRLDEAVMV